MSEREDNGGIIPPHIASQLRWERDEPEVWREFTAGLPDYELTVGGFLSDAFPLLPWLNDPKRDVVVRVPDGRWQAFKWELKRWWPFCWLKVRYRTYRFEGVIQPWSNVEKVNIRAHGPFEASIEEER